MDVVKWEDLTPLKQNISQYDPDEQQVLSYAEYLGFNMPQDYKYMTFVVQALKAPLPKDWQACIGPHDEIYYRNLQTKAIQDYNPLDDFYIKKVQQLKNIQNIYAADPILEESIMKESSGIYGSNLKSSEQLQSNNNSSMQTSKIEREKQQRHELIKNITEEESLYSKSHSDRSLHEISLDISQQSSNEQKEVQKLVKASIHNIQFRNKVQQKLKNQHLLEINRIKIKISKNLPEKTQLLFKTNNFMLNSKEKNTQKNAINALQITNIQEMKMMIEEKKVKLNMLEQRRKQKEKLLEKLKENHDFKIKNIMNS